MVINFIKKHNYKLKTKMYESSYKEILLESVLMDSIKNSIRVKQYDYLVKMIDYNIDYTKNNITELLRFCIINNKEAVSIICNLNYDFNINYGEILITSFEAEDFEILDEIYKKTREILFKDIYHILLKKDSHIYEKILKYKINIEGADLYYFFSELLKNREEKKINLLLDHETFQSIGFKITF